MNGILVIDKEKGFTSRDVVNVVSSFFHMKKVGHIGTLDPIATGVLVLCLGSYTKLVSLLINHDKEYIATIFFGFETDTLDVTGSVLNQSNIIPTKEEFQKVLAKFVGKQKQTVPLYSAKKVKGKKLYEYAREGIDVVLPQEEIEVYDLKLLEFKDKQAIIHCHVSKGTYIRSLVRDICHACNTVGSMKDLRRVKLGNFSLDDTYTLDDIKKGTFNLLSFKDIFDYETYYLNEKELFKVSNGNELKLLISSSYVLLMYNSLEIALYQKKNSIYVPLLRFDKS